MLKFKKKKKKKKKKKNNATIPGGFLYLHDLHIGPANCLCGHGSDVHRSQESECKREYYVLDTLL